MKNVLIAAFTLFAATLWSQQLTITGELQDNSQMPIAYAAVTFEGLSNNVFEQIFTEGDGSFTAEIPKGKYNMLIQLPTGSIIEREEEFTENRNFGVIQLDNAIQLSETVAVGEKPLYRLELDKRVYDMERDPSIRGTNLSDALNNVPSVQVDSEGEVSLRGNSSVRILINGKPSAMTGISDVASALKTIPSETVERVEVITNPSARYDAEGGGGIINIILKKGTNLGFNASITGNLGYQPEAGISAALNYKTEKWNFFLNPSYRYEKSIGESSFRSLFYYPNDIDSLEVTERERERERFGGSVNLGFEHYLTDKTTVTVSGNYRNTPSESENRANYFDYANDVLYAETNRVDNEREDEYSVEGNIGLKHEFNGEGHELNIQSSASYSKEDENSTIAEIVTFGTGDDIQQRGFTYEQENRFLVQADYVYPIGENIKFEAGYKSEWEHEVNDFALSDLVNGAYVTDPDFADVVDFNQNVHAFYTQYGQKIGRFSFLGGLRLEHSDISINSAKNNSEDIKNYTDFFPSATLNYTLDEDEENQLQLSYSRRIRRPWSRFLNPAYNFSDIRNTFKGNPDLDPTYSNSIELAYITSIGKTTITPSVYYNKSTNDLNIFRRVEELPLKGRVFVTQPVNAGDQERYGAEIVVSTQPATWWRLFGNFNLFGYKSDGAYIAEDGTSYSFEGDGISWFSRISNNFTLPSKIGFQLNGYFRGAQENAQERRKANFSVDVALTKDVLQDRGTLSFNVRDVFNSRRRQETQYGDGFISETDMQWRPRSFNLSFTYRINQNKKRDRNGRNGEEFDGNEEGMDM